MSAFGWLVFVVIVILLGWVGFNKKDGPDH